MLYKLPDGRRVAWYYQTHPVLGFMVKRLRDGRYFDETAFQVKGRDYWVKDCGTLHEFEYAKTLMGQLVGPCELEIVIDRYGELTRPRPEKMGDNR
jgi:hypothetical protein